MNHTEPQSLKRTPASESPCHALAMRVLAKDPTVWWIGDGKAKPPRSVEYGFLPLLYRRHRYDTPIPAFLFVGIGSNALTRVGISPPQSYDDVDLQRLTDDLGALVDSFLQKRQIPHAFDLMPLHEVIPSLEDEFLADLETH